MAEDECLRDQAIGSWLDELASAAPAPGGGAAAAISAALGAALVAMVCNLTIGKPRYGEHEPLMREALACATRLRAQAIQLAADDAIAFGAVADAYRLPATNEAIAADVASRSARLSASGAIPALAVVVAVDDEATMAYLRSIERAAARVGITCRIDKLANADDATIGAHLQTLSADPGVDGVICQTPLPPGISLASVAAHIDPAKDVDGANPASLGRLTAGLTAYAPATAEAVLEILRYERVPLSGARAVVIGRSTVVGKPAALLLLAEHATVTICHSRTTDLATVCAQADVLVAAAGQARLVGTAHIKPGAVVIDAGINATEDGGLAGDVDPGQAGAAAALTPVPGGVGPVTTMVLARHTIAAAESRAS